MNIHLLLIFVVFCWLLGDSLEFWSSDDFIIYAVWRKENKHHCVTSIITSRSVLTSCNCIGKFVQSSKKYFQFSEVVLDNLMLKAYKTKRTFDIDRAITHAHCRPSLWDNSVYVYNLGAWMTKGSFDLSYHTILSPPEFTDYENSGYKLLLPKLEKCFVFGNSKEKHMHFELNTGADMGKCIDLYCVRKKITACQEIHGSVIRDSEMCGVLSANTPASDDVGLLGSPIVCEISFEEYAIYGVIADDIDNIIIWSRLDKSPNSDYYKAVYRGDLASITRSGFQQIITVLLILHICDEGGIVEGGRYGVVGDRYSPIERYVPPGPRYERYNQPVPARYVDPYTRRDLFQPPVPPPPRYLRPLHRYTPRPTRIEYRTHVEYLGSSGGRSVQTDFSTESGCVDFDQENNSDDLFRATLYINTPRTPREREYSRTPPLGRGGGGGESGERRLGDGVPLSTSPAPLSLCCSSRRSLPPQPTQQPVNNNHHLQHPPTIWRPVSQAPSPPSPSPSPPSQTTTTPPSVLDSGVYSRSGPSSEAPSTCSSGTGSTTGAVMPTPQGINSSPGGPASQNLVARSHSEDTGSIQEPTPHRRVILQHQQSLPVTQSEVANNQQRAFHRSNSRSDIIKQKLKKNAAMFFGVDEATEEKEKNIWMGRRKRLASRRYGELKAEFREGTGPCADQRQATPQSLKPDIILPAGGGRDENDSATRWQSSGSGNVASRKQKPSVASMTFKGVAFIANALNKHRSRDSISRGRRSTRSYSPSTVGGVTPQLSASTPMDDDEVFFDRTPPMTATTTIAAPPPADFVDSTTETLPVTLDTTSRMRDSSYDSSQMSPSNRLKRKLKIKVELAQRKDFFENTLLHSTSSEDELSNEGLYLRRSNINDIKKKLTLNLVKEKPGFHRRICFQDSNFQPMNVFQWPNDISDELRTGGEFINRSISMNDAQSFSKLEEAHGSWKRAAGEAKRDGSASHIGLGRISGIELDRAHDNSDRRQFGQGIIHRVFGRSLKRSVMNREPVKEVLEDLEDHRPFFTYWLSTVQILILVISLVSYGFGPFGMDLNHQSGLVLVTSLSLQQVEYTEPANFWLGPRAADLIYLGAKFAPCMRRDAKIMKEIDKGRERERETACCIRNDDSGCVQSSKNECSETISTFKKWGHPDAVPGGRISGSVCGLDPKYCEAPASIAPYEWPDDITKWPICRKTSSPLQRARAKDRLAAEHMICDVIGHPCCIGIHATCRITTKEYCDFVHGHFHEEASLCSQVSCLDNVCGMLPFMNSEVPDQFYRLITSIFLHAGVIQLAISLCIQWFLMRDLEKLTGTARIIIIYIGSGVAGNLASAIFVPYRADVGPAGSQSGLLACLIVEILNMWPMLKHPYYALFKHLTIALILFVIGLLPWFDNFSSFFGFIFGFLLSYAILPFVSLGEYDRQKKIFLIWVCLITTVFLFLLLVLFFYVIPVYDCEICGYFNCLPLTRDFCSSQNINFKRSADVV